MGCSVWAPSSESSSGLPRAPASAATSASVWAASKARLSAPASIPELDGCLAPPTAQKWVSTSDRPTDQRSDAHSDSHSDCSSAAWWAPKVGCNVGSMVGSRVVGPELGWRVGCHDGSSVGCNQAQAVGGSVLSNVGCAVGDIDGEWLGTRVGGGDGIAVG